MKVLNGEELAWLTSDLLEKKHGQCLVNQVLLQALAKLTFTPPPKDHQGTNTEITYNVTGKCTLC